MNRKQFFEEFEKTKSYRESLESKKSELSKQIKETNTDLEKINKINQVLSGLHMSPEDQDPGKNRPSYFFVEKITDSDIIPNEDNEPKKYATCPACDTKRPIILRYHQTIDSDYGDRWEKAAYIICPNDGLTFLKGESRTHRFL